MNNSSTQLEHIFKIHRAREKIFRHVALTWSDLAHASFMSHVWHFVVSPFLWKRVEVAELNEKNRDGFRSGLKTYGHWIRQLDSRSTEVLNLVAKSSNCIRLVDIQFDLLNDCLETSHHVNTIVTKNPELKRFRCYGDSSDTVSFSRVARGLMTIYSNCLTDLDLACLKLGTDFSLVLNHHASTLTNLRILGCLLGNCAFVGLYRLPKITTLFWNDNVPESNMRKDFGEGFFDVLDVLHDLQELTIGASYDILTLALPDVLLSNALSGLKILAVKCLYNPTLKDKRTATLLTCAPASLEHLAMDTFEMDDLSNHALVILTTTNRLTSIRLTNCSGITGQTWQTILTSCQWLVQIGGNHCSPLDAQFMTKPWVCTGLEIFEMCILVGHQSSEGVFLHNSVQSDTVMIKDCRAIFLQMAVLTRLQVLRLGLNSPNSGLLQPTDEGDSTKERSQSATALSAKEQKFLAMWRILKTCLDLQEVDFRTSLPERMIHIDELKKMGRKMWGSKVKISISRGVRIEV